MATNTIKRQIVRTALPGRYAVSDPTLDPDALDYIRRVEAAEGTRLPPAVRTAMSSFIEGCKIDGLWPAIKAACFLAGPRTLTGALIPLVGPAPTNVNFVAGDYVAKTGLRGNGTTGSKHLVSAVRRNDMPQNNIHLSAWVTEQQASSIGFYIAPASTNDDLSVNRNTDAIGCRNRGHLHTRIGISAATGFVGTNRAAASEFTFRADGSTDTVAGNSTTANDELFNVFIRNTVSPNPFPLNGRIAFYSIGESINLAQLDSRLTAYMAAITAADYFDADATDYISRVEAVDGRVLPDAVRAAINDFVVGCKADGTWTALKAACFLSGPRTLAGALVPLIGAAPTNFNFVSGDYDIKTGLKGNGSTKYLDSNRNDTSDPLNSHHLSVWVSTTATANYCDIGTMDGVSPTASAIMRVNAENQLIAISRRLNSSVPRIAVSPSSVGFRGVTRMSATAMASRVGGTTFSTTENSSVIGSGTTRIFQRGVDGFGPSNGRYAWYSIGESLNLDQLDTRLTTYMAAITAATYPAAPAPPPPLYDRDARAYFARVTDLGGHFASSSYTSIETRAAINQWFVAVKDFGLWDKIAEAYLFAGCTFPGVLAKLKRSTTANLINNNFVSGDYVQAGSGAGLKGNASNKRLETEFFPNTVMSVSTGSLGIYAEEMETATGGRGFIMTADAALGTAPHCAILNDSGGRRAAISSHWNSPTTLLITSATVATAFEVISRVSTTDFRWFRNGTQLGATNTLTNAGITSGSLGLFSYRYGTGTGSYTHNSFSAMRAKFAFAGTGLTAAETTSLSTTTNALMTALGANVY